jgi:non-specific serine/threonine protein kinase
MAAAPLPDPSPPRAVRTLGRFELRRLLGKSVRSMVWLVFDPRGGHELVLVMPRAQPADAAALERWTAAARKASRLDHPRLAHAVEIGEHERWPYVAYDRANGLTLAERATAGGEPAEVARWIAQALDGLAFAHEAGVAHRDLQPHMLVLSEQGALRLIGLEAASDGQADDLAEASMARALSVDPLQLRRQRDAAERDVLAIGLVMHHLLAGRPALDEPDTARVIERLPPLGHEIVRLPWGTGHPVPEPLRSIVNRASDRQPRQRYRSARTLARALEGWIEADAQQDGGAHAQLLDRVRRNGALPALPGGSARAAQLATMERERTNELAELVLRDLALAFELLRVVNTAQVRGAQIAGNGPVLTVRRAIALVGLDGVRHAANALRAWPGPLSQAAAADLTAQIDDATRAARVAQMLRPAGYDAEVVHLVTLLQNLGRLVVQYHFPEEAAQIRHLMRPAPAAKPGEPDEPGMTEEAAAFAVLGADIESMGCAVARYWGLDESVLHMIRRLPATTPVRAIDRDEDLLRAVASAANEAVDAATLPPRMAAAALERVAQRYARPLALSLKDLQGALQGLPLRREAAPHDEPSLTGARS